MSQVIQSAELQLRKIRFLISFFILSLILSGLTAFPINTQLAIGHELIQKYEWNNALTAWLEKVYIGVRETDSQYPFIAYGTDWLAFAHLVIAIAFIGPLRDPVRNVWVIHFGIIACLGIFPLALIAGAIREIPLFWRFIDCSFGLVGGALLWHCNNMIKRLAAIQ